MPPMIKYIYLQLPTLHSTRQHQPSVINMAAGQHYHARCPFHIIIGMASAYDLIVINTISNERLCMVLIGR